MIGVLAISSSSRRGRLQTNGGGRSLIPFSEATLGSIKSFAIRANSTHSTKGLPTSNIRYWTRKSTLAPTFWTRFSSLYLMIETGDSSILPLFWTTRTIVAEIGKLPYSNIIQALWGAVPLSLGSGPAQAAPSTAMTFDTMSQNWLTSISAFLFGPCCNPRSSGFSTEKADWYGLQRIAERDLLLPLWTKNSG